MCVSSWLKAFTRGTTLDADLFPDVLDSLFCSASATHRHAIIVRGVSVDHAGAMPG
jgi:hypothetical protein